jgi:hypothetical protein
MICRCHSPHIKRNQHITCHFPHTYDDKHASGPLRSLMHQHTHSSTILSAQRTTHLIGHEELGSGKSRRRSTDGLLNLADGGSEGHGRRSGGKGRDGGRKDGSGELHYFDIDELYYEIVSNRPSSMPVRKSGESAVRSRRRSRRSSI